MNTQLFPSLALFAVISASALAAAEPPNLVFVIADDMTFRDIGCYGGQAHTPNIDRLATEGMRFTRCFQSAPMCSPTRHNIYTGLYSGKSGAESRSERSSQPRSTSPCGLMTSGFPAKADVPT